MKTLLSTIVTLLAGCILLSSCNQGAGIALTKRHYNKGYYVDISSKRETVKPKQLTIVDKGTNISAPAQTIAPLAVNATDPNNTTITDNQVTTNTTTTRAENRQALKNAIRHVNYKSVKALVATSIAHRAGVVQSENAPQGIMATTDDGGHHVHSLLWLIVVIILILWLIGILTGSFGIGILINLLLLVALVLLILWLLWLI